MSTAEYLESRWENFVEPAASYSGKLQLWPGSELHKSKVQAVPESVRRLMVIP